MYSPDQLDALRSSVQEREDWARLFDIRKVILYNLLRNKRIINVGCGVFTKTAMNELGVTNDSVGVELDRYAIRLAKNANVDVNIIRADARFLPIRDKSFGYAVSSEVIEHMKTEKDASQLAFELDRVSNNAIITTPNSNFGIKIRDPTHSLFFTRRTLCKALGTNWTIYTTRKTLPNLLSYLLPYTSPKITFLRCFFQKFDQMIEFSSLNRIAFFIFRGAFLIAINSVKSQNCPSLTSRLRY